MQVELHKIYANPMMRAFKPVQEYSGDTFSAPQPDFDTYEPQGTTGFQGTQIDKKGYNPEGLPREEENPSSADSGDTYISREQAKYIYDKMKYQFDFEEFFNGMNVELEHKDITNGNVVLTAKIVVAHLKENPHYYSMLKKYVEKEDAVALASPDGTINGAPKPKDVKKIRKQLNTESKMIRLQDIIMENSAQGYVQNRVNLAKIVVIMEKVLPAVDKSVATKLTEIFAEVSNITNTMNTTPYKRTEESLAAWRLAEAALYAKICEMKEEVEKLCESDKVNVKPLVKALAEIIN